MELTRMPRRLPTLAAAAAAVCLFALGAGATSAAADATQPPVVTGISPQVLTPNGQPQHLVVTGFNLTTVNQVFLNPVVLGRSFSVVADTVVVLTLPADVPAGTYTVELVSPAGASNPGAAEITVGTAAVQPPAGAAVQPPVPAYSFAPAPVEQPEPLTGVVGAGTTVEHTTPPSPRPLNPLLLLPLGGILGGLGYLLWGRPGRLAAADRQGLGAHLVGRPVQALHIGRICLQCGRLHFVLKTRRDLWQAGQFCSATCFVAAQEDDSAAKVGESTAVTRMREMFVYSELEQSLQAALAGDMHTSLEVVQGSGGPVDAPAPIAGPAEDEQAPLVKASAAG
jgi:hypothetical protein